MKCFKEDPEITRGVEKLMESVENLGRGDFIPHEIVCSIIGYKKGTAKWGSIVGKWRKLMRKERGLLVVNDRGRGYHIGTAKDSTFYEPMKHINKSRRQNWFALRIYRDARTDDLSDHEKQARAIGIEQSKRGYNQAKAIKRGLVKIEKNEKPKRKWSLLRKGHKNGVKNVPKKRPETPEEEAIGARA